MMTQDFIVGLIEGEGCFNISKSRKSSVNYVNKKGIKKTYVCSSIQRQFRLGMHERDKDLLIQVQKTIGGYIYAQKNNMIILSITNQEQRLKLINFIDTSCGLHGFKKKQYEEWKKQAIIA